MLMEVGQFDHHLVRVRLPSAQTTRLDLSRFGAFGASFGGVGVGPDGTVYAMSTFYGIGSQESSQLFAAKPGANVAQPLGRVLKQASTFQLRGTSAVAFGCFERFSRDVFTMDVGVDRIWRTSADGCVAALSPEGTELAWVNRGVLWQRALPDGTPERTLNLAELPGLASAGIGAVPDGNTTMQWGRGGMSVMVGEPNAFALIVLRRGRPPLIVPLGSTQPRPMAWQPNGNLLAFGDYDTDSQTAEVRVLDPTSGAIRQVAAMENFGAFQWSPDGTVLAVVRAESVTAFVDLNGRQLGVMGLGGVPDAWLP